jgi:hypothetical protein
MDTVKIRRKFNRAVGPATDALERGADAEEQNGRTRFIVYSQGGRWQREPVVSLQDAKRVILAWVFADLLDPNCAWNNFGLIDTEMSPDIYGEECEYEENGEYIMDIMELDNLVDDSL